MLDLALSLLSAGNFILASANILIAFSLLLYLLANNFRNRVAAAFSALLFFIAVSYVGNVFLLRIGSLEDAELWLRFKWIGIAFMPAAYLHFSTALLRTTAAPSASRRLIVPLAYLASAAFLLLVVFSDLVVCCVANYPWATQFRDGPLFWLFAAYFFSATGWGLLNLRSARIRTLTTASRRRMTYLAVAFLAPALGVFPYLIISSFPAQSPILLNSLTLVVNLGIAVMMVVMGYTVAYQGAFVPDRVVKHRLIHFLLRGPFVATCVVIALTIVPPIERFLHLSHETLLFATVMVGIVVFELVIMIARPFLDRIIFNQDRKEIEQIQELEKRLFTTSDLQQLMENILAAVCDLLRVEGGYVAALQPEGFRVQTTAGDRNAMGKAAERVSPDLLPADGNGNGHFLPSEGFWIYPLYGSGREALIGVLGIVARTREPDLNEHEQEMVEALVSQIELGLEDWQLQQNVFLALEQLNSEIALLQRARSKPRYAGVTAQERVEEELVPSVDFHRAVKDALDHYWGGPKLTHSPLLQLQVVQSLLDEYDQNPIRALRALLVESIESLKPDGERSLTAPEWVLYNILELKVVQGKKVREIAARLAMSESDLYRKQRVAVQQVAKHIQQLEEENKPTS